MSDTEATVQFQILYYGTKGDESFDLHLFGKKMEFRNIGTSQNNLVRRITGPVENLKLKLYLDGGRHDYKCWTVPDSRRCSTGRRWGKRWRRCGGRAAYKQCSGEDWTRSVVIKKLLINGTDMKEFFYRSVTSCDPKSGNVTKIFPITRGIIDIAGNYTIAKSDIYDSATGSFVPKPEYDVVVNELDTTQTAHKSSIKNFSSLTGKHGVLTNKYNALLARFGITGDTLKKQDGVIKKTEKKVVSANKLASTIEQQALDLQTQLNEAENIADDAAVDYGNEQARRFSNTEQENANIHKENKDRSQTNDTFKKKTYYQQENITKFTDYNYIMFYFYMFLVFSTIVMCLFKDSNDFDKLKKNIWYSIAFFLLIFLFPFYIYKFEIKVLQIINYIYALFTASVYNETTI